MAYHASHKIGQFLLAPKANLPDNSQMALPNKKEAAEIQRLLRSDPARKNLFRLLEETGTDMKELSLALDRNHAYIYQYLNKGKPVRLSEVIREKIGQFFGEDPNLFRSDEYPTAFERRPIRSTKPKKTGKITNGYIHREKVIDAKVVGVSVAEDSFSVGRQDYVLIAGFDASVSAGPGNMNVDNPEPLFHNAYRLDWIHSITRTPASDLAILKVDGDSMEPTLHADDHVLVDRGIKSFGSDGLYVLDINDTLIVKRVKCSKGNGLIDIISDNQTYPIEDDQDPNLYTVRGRVLWLGRRIA